MHEGGASDYDDENMRVGGFGAAPMLPIKNIFPHAATERRGNLPEWMGDFSVCSGV